MSRAGLRIAAVLLLAFAVRCAAGERWQARLPEGERFGFGDSDGYWQLARSIVAGEPYQYGSSDARVFRTPGYPLLLAGLFKIVGSDPPVMWARALSALLTTLGVGGVMWLAHELFGARTALVAGILAALYPGAIALGALVLSEAPFSALVPWQLALWTKAWRAESQRALAGWSVLTGVVGGAATLMRPSWLLFSPLAILLGVACSRCRWRHAAVGAGVLAGLCAMMAPWWIRNARVIGHFVPTTLQVGASLYDGLNPRATGASNMDFVPALEEELRAADRAHPEIAASAPFEYRFDRFLRDASLRWAAAHPGRVLQLAVIKLTRIWNVWPNEPQLRRPLVCAAVLVTYVPLLTLGLLGAWRFCRRGWPYVLCVLPAGYITLLHMIFVSSIRYREPAMLVLIVLAAGWIMDRSASTEPQSKDAQPSSVV